MSINMHTGNIEEIAQNYIRLRQAPAGEVPASARAQAEVNHHTTVRNAAVEMLASADETKHCGKSAFISGIACSDAAKALLADLFVAPTAAKSRGQGRG